MFNKKHNIREYVNLGNFDIKYLIKAIFFILLHIINAISNGIIMIYMLFIATCICEQMYSKVIQSNPWWQL